MRAVVHRWWLAVWFALVTVPFLVVPVIRGASLPIDALLYERAARLWLAGGDPWSAQVTGLYFAAPPPTLLALLPFALLPEVAGTLLLSLVTLGGGLATIRMLRLPWWWLLFPPLAQGILSGNIQTLLVPLLLAPRAAFLAPLGKVYGALPMAILGRWRGLLLAAAIVVITAPLLPWALYASRFAEINGVLAGQSRDGPSFVGAVVLVPIALPCLWLVGRANAAWLVVPALWPSQQWYYGTLAMPTRSRLVGAILAAPFPLAGAVALVAMAVGGWFRGGRPGRHHPWPRPSRGLSGSIDSLRRARSREDHGEDPMTHSSS
jgi:hypothetical protein